MLGGGGGYPHVGGFGADGGGGGQLVTDVGGGRHGYGHTGGELSPETDVGGLEKRIKRSRMVEVEGKGFFEGMVQFSC